MGGVVHTVESLLSTLLGGVLGTGLGSLLTSVLGGVLPPVISTVEQLLVQLISLLAGGTGLTSGGTCIASNASTNSTLSGPGGTVSSTGIGNSLNKSAETTIVGNENTVVKLVSVDGTVLCSLFLLDSILGTGFIGNSANGGFLIGVWSLIF